MVFSPIVSVPDGVVGRPGMLGAVGCENSSQSPSSISTGGGGSGAGAEGDGEEGELGLVLGGATGSSGVLHAESITNSTTAVISRARILLVFILLFPPYYFYQ